MGRCECRPVRMISGRAQIAPSGSPRCGNRDDREAPAAERQRQSVLTCEPALERQGRTWQIVESKGWDNGS